MIAVNFTNTFADLYLMVVVWGTSVGNTGGLERKPNRNRWRNVSSKYRNDVFFLNLRPTLGFLVAVMVVVNEG